MGNAFPVLHDSKEEFGDGFNQYASPAQQLEVVGHAVRDPIIGTYLDAGSEATVTKDFIEDAVFSELCKEGRLMGTGKNHVRFSIARFSP